MKQTVNLMMQLIKSEICNVPLAESCKQPLSEETAQKLYKLSKMHDLAHIVGHAVKSNGLLEQGSILKMFEKKLHVSVYRNGIIDDEFGRVCEYLESEKIPFVPLKGEVLKDYYPEAWMRTRCDIDILVHEEDLKRAVEMFVDKHGYKNEGLGTHDVSLFSPSKVHVELHYKLDEVYYDSTAGKYLDTVWDHVQLENDCKYLYRLDDDFYYFYHIYHMAKHFEKGGCGVRPFLDLWILENNVVHDESKRDSLLEQNGIKKFADNCRNLSRYWFSEDKETELVLSLQHFVLSGGVYGNKENRVSIQQTKSKSKLEYIFSRLFMPFDKLKYQYPVLKKHKWMTPFCEIHRCLRLLTPNVFKKAKREIEHNGNTPNEESQKMTEFLNNIGLK